MITFIYNRSTNINYFIYTSQQKYCRRQYAALTYTCRSLEGVSQLSLVYDLAGGIFIQLLDDGDVLGGKAVVLHQLTDGLPGIPVHAVKYLLEIHKDAVQGDCHSRDCSIMILIVAMWSVQGLSCRNSACSSHRVLSRVVLSLSRIILDSTFPVIERSMIPLQCCIVIGRPF